MEVTVAGSAGFCFGVKRAVDTVYEQIENGRKPVYTYGPIIHNEQVVGDLERRGVQVIGSEEELEKLTEGTVIIRSHGVSRRICDKIRAQGLTLVDATCPFVRKIHRIVERESENGRHIVIIGSEPHPEVEGIKGWARGPVTVISTAEEAEKFTPESGKAVSIVAQTTFNYNKFKDLVEIFSKKSYDISVLNTICNATEERQTEARDLAATVDAMIVIGGRHSSNTQKLYEICKEECKNTYFIETLV
ncbi:MAG TPA: 4-hydroxy-3-methylbut-2-enyl diphosphate reductase, partial [Candidatus Fusicatenibacter merdavium]|nr:4-hydroxy-3-methylbut-2-enyl diphosphate reductase [Candidatus Fusicatenibacter merdavium]